MGSAVNGVGTKFSIEFSIYGHMANQSNTKLFLVKLSFWSWHLLVEIAELCVFISSRISHAFPNWCFHQVIDFFWFLLISWSCFTCHANPHLTFRSNIFLICLNSGSSIGWGGHREITRFLQAHSTDVPLRSLSPKKVVGCRGESRNVAGCWGFPYLKIEMLASFHFMLLIDMEFISKML